VGLPPQHGKNVGDQSEEKSPNQSPTGESTMNINLINRFQKKQTRRKPMKNLSQNPSKPFGKPKKPKKP
jgi:hypothetical protein